MEMTTLAMLGETALAMAPEYGIAALSAVCASSGRRTLDGRSGPGLLRCFPRRSRRRELRRSEHGEGVISAAIAVLIVASLGALMWVGFKTLWENAEETTNSEISKIGK